MFKLSSLAIGTVNYIRRLGLNGLNNFALSKMPGRYTFGNTIDELLHRFPRLVAHSVYNFPNTFSQRPCYPKCLSMNRLPQMCYPKCNTMDLYVLNTL